MQTRRIDDPTWKHLLDRDDLLKELSAAILKHTTKSRESFCTPEDIDRLERTAQKALKFIGA